MIKTAVFAEKKEAETLLGSFDPALKQWAQGNTRSATTTGARFVLIHHIRESQEKKSSVHLFPPARLLVITGRDSPKLLPRTLPS